MNIFFVIVFISSVEFNDHLYTYRFFCWNIYKKIDTKDFLRQQVKNLNYLEDNFLKFSRMNILIYIITNTSSYKFKIKFLSFIKFLINQQIRKNCTYLKSYKTSINLLLKITSDESHTLQHHLLHIVSKSMICSFSLYNVTESEVK